jgi:hypothetical protein
VHLEPALRNGLAQAEEQIGHSSSGSSATNTTAGALSTSE